MRLKESVSTLTAAILLLFLAATTATATPLHQLGSLAPAMLPNPHVSPVSSLGGDVVHQETTRPTSYTVVHGDSLATIAAAQLGSAARWHDLWYANYTHVHDADLIFPGQSLALPAGHVTQPAALTAALKAQAAARVKAEARAEARAKARAAAAAKAAARARTVHHTVPRHHSTSTHRSVTHTSTLVVHTSSGVYGRIEKCESGGRNVNQAQGLSSASGYFQIEDGTWDHFDGYPRAIDAPYSVQLARAEQLPLSAWDASRSCWG